MNVRNKEDKSKKDAKVNMIYSSECSLFLCGFIFGMSCFSFYVYCFNIHYLLTKQNLICTIIDMF